MTSQNDKCSFSVGDHVIYQPTSRGLGLEVMSSQKLLPGKEYKILEIQKDFYVVVEGYSHPSGGLFWTEFKSAE